MSMITGASVGDVIIDDMTLDIPSNGAWTTTREDCVSVGHITRNHIVRLSLVVQASQKLSITASEVLSLMDDLAESGVTPTLELIEKLYLSIVSPTRRRV